MNDDIKTRSTITAYDSSGIKSEKEVATFKDLRHIMYKFEDAYIHSNLVEKSDSSDYSYVEVQIHGELRFDRDVNKIMVREDTKGIVTPYLKNYFKVIGKKIPIGYFPPPY
jgi:hypothetical protein